jgi:hypothetical protein
MSGDCALMLRDAVVARRNHQRFVKGRPSFESALADGIRRAQRDYGDKLIEVVGKQMREGNWRAAVSGLMTLARFYPQGLFRRARRRVSGFAPDLQG